MISAGDLRKGVTLRMDGNLYRVTNTVYNKPGRGTASMRTTLMDIRTGNTSQKIFGIEEKLDNIFVDTVPVEYLYNDGEFLNFMNTENYEQYQVSQALFGDDIHFLKEGMALELRLYEGSAIDYVLPTKVVYKVVDSEMAVAGDTAGSVTKKVTTESGLTVQVPLFINVGDGIEIDTRDGAYLGRG
jgi:elongation factor P